MLTLQKLKDMQPHEQFAIGTVIDGPDGVNMSASGQELKWVAQRGGIHDWAIYIGRSNLSAVHIGRFGDKVHDKENIKKLVPCDDEAFKMYRH